MFTEIASRNDLCPCGSGEKLKHCCLPRENWHPDDEIDPATLRAISHNRPVPRIAEYERAKIFAPRSCSWSDGRVRDAEPGDELIVDGRFFRVMRPGEAVEFSEIEIAKLVDADRPFDPANCRRPKSDDVVYVVDRGHCLLSQTRPFQTVRFQGRFYLIEPTAKPNEFKLVDSGRVDRIPTSAWMNRFESESVSDSFEDGTARFGSTSANVLPIEIGLKYTYPEQFGLAHVTHILPAGRIYQLATGEEIVNDDLQPGMQVVLRDGAIGTISAVDRYYEPPEPPVQLKPGLFLSRVIGTIRHQGIKTINVSWSEDSVRSSPDHKYYSVSRGGYVGASELQVGEILLGDDGREVTITAVGERNLGLIDLYNIEVEHFHTYFVGKGPSVLVHNGATGEGGQGGYINTPADKGPARQRSAKRREFMGQNPNKTSTTYDLVVKRMRQEGKFTGEGADAKVLASNGNWIPLKDAELSHVQDAVKWWNEVGRFTGARSPEVRRFMTKGFEGRCTQHT